jgi:hypothetical protein
MSSGCGVRVVKSSGWRRLRMKTELEKELADKLGSISGPMFRDYKPWPKWDLIARECIRQMEWARRNCAVNGIWPPPLTLAPESWKVEDIDMKV